MSNIEQECAEFFGGVDNIRKMMFETIKKYSEKINIEELSPRVKECLGSILGGKLINQDDIQRICLQLRMPVDEPFDKYFENDNVNYDYFNQRLVECGAWATPGLSKENFTKTQIILTALNSLGREEKECQMATS